MGSGSNVLVNRLKIVCISELKCYVAEGIIYDILSVVVIVVVVFVVVVVVVVVVPDMLRVLVEATTVVRITSRSARHNIDNRPLKMLRISLNCVNH